MKIKNPAAPATDKQLDWIKSLRDELNITPSDLSMLTKGEASALIDQLLEMKKGGAPVPAPAPKVNLAALAAQMEGTPVIEDEAQIPFTADADKPVLSLTLAQVKVALSWYGVVQGETDPTDDDDALEAILQLTLAAQTAPAAPAPVEPKAIAPKTADGIGIVAGHYAIGPVGDTKFYKISYGKPGGKWAGFCFVDVQASDDFHPVKGAAKFAVLEAIKADPMAAATRYGKEIGKCWNCHKTLTDPHSIEQGMGDDCKAKLGL